MINSMPPANLVNGHHPVNDVDAIEQKKRLTHVNVRFCHCQATLEADVKLGSRRNLLSGPGNGAAKVGSFQERRVDLYGSIFNFPV